MKKPNFLLNCIGCIASMYVFPFLVSVVFELLMSVDVDMFAWVTGSLLAVYITYGKKSKVESLDDKSTNE